MTDIRVATSVVLNVLHEEHPSVAAVERAITVVDEVLAERVALAAEIAARRPEADPSVPLSRELEYIQRDIDADLQMLDTGVKQGDGVSNAKLEALRGLHGRDWWRRTRERLVKIREQEVGRATETGKRPFKYTGPRHKAFIDGRYLEPGDVVLLNSVQAEAWQDRFEIVQQEPQSL